MSDGRARKPKVWGIIHSGYGMAITVCVLFSNFSIHAQIHIHNNSQVKARGQLTTNVSFTNASNASDLNDVKITLVGVNQQINTTQETVIANLEVNNISISTISGNWKITNGLSLINGILHVNDNARLVYLGSAVVEGSNRSYVEGYFTQSGSGHKFFPIGADGFYLPATVEDVPSGTNEVSMRAVQGDAALQLPNGISSYVASHYWQLSPVIASPVSLSLLNVGQGNSENFVVLQSGAIKSTATSLLGLAKNDFITTSDNVTQQILTIGKRAEFSIIIHDMITPFVKDEINDNLVIENIEKTTSNVVTLLDRWGVKVKEWQNYLNNTQYDFSTLSPGNYICIVKFTTPEGSQSTQKGMITILNTK